MFVPSTTTYLPHPLPHVQEEKLRITRAGGSVDFSGVWRVAHPAIPMRLAVSRALGDPSFKRLDGYPPSGKGNGAIALTLTADGLAFERRGGSDPVGDEDEEEEGELSAAALPGAEPLVSPVPYVHCREVAADDLLMVLMSDG